MINRKKLFIVPLIVISGAIFGINDNYVFPPRVFDSFCKEKSDFIIYSVNTHGRKNVNLLYRYLYDKGSKINGFLEGKFLDESNTNAFFNGIRLTKGDVAWFLYSDINFNDNVYRNLLNKYNISTGMELFFETVKNPLLREEYLKIIESQN